jgi:hypothetical protein
LQIKTVKTATGHRVNIKEVIKTIEDSGSFKKELTDIVSSDPHSTVEVHILDSYIITSSIIGTLMKLIQKDGAKISIHTYNADLFELLDKLNLVQLLNVKKNF